MVQETSAEHVFGGDWTRHKLRVLSGYLDSYTTALKNQPFNLVYIDAFAGQGIWVSEDGKQVDGSPLIALDVENSPFHQLWFNDSNVDAIAALKTRVEKRYSNRSGIYYSNEEAEDFIEMVTKTTSRTSNRARGVLFVDPFNTAGWSWRAMEAVAATRVLDALILFPAGATWRQMPKLKDTDSPHPFESNLTRYFGDQSWKHAYDANKVSDLIQRHGLDDGAQDTLQGLGIDARSEHEYIAYIYKEKLETVFGAVDMKPVRLDVTGQPYFELIFAVSNPEQRAQQLAMRIFRGVVGSLT